MGQITKDVLHSHSSEKGREAGRVQTLDSSYEGSSMLLLLFSPERILGSHSPLRVHGQCSRPLQMPPLTCSFNGFSFFYSLLLMPWPSPLMGRDILCRIDIILLFALATAPRTPLHPSSASIHMFSLPSEFSSPSYSLLTSLVITLYGIPPHFPCCL